MKRHLAHALFSLSLCAVMGGVRTAGAQPVDGISPPTVDSMSVVIVAPLAPDAPLLPTVIPVTPGRPTVMAPTPILLNDARRGAQDLPFATPVAMVDWKMPTSRVLMIGGAAVAIVGLAAIGGDTGAIVALSGTAVAVYGLYLHYNR
jgi:hypothetical protein